MGQTASSDGRALCQAIKRNDNDAVRRILAENPTAVLSTTFWKRNTPLMLASEKGNILTVSTLLWASEQVLSAGYPSYINAANSRGNTALHCAIKRGHITVVRILLEEGATPLPANRRGDTPLHIAAQRGYTSCVELLLDAPVRALGGASPLAAYAPVRDMAGESRYIDALNGGGFTALHLATFSRNHATVAAFVARGAALDVPVARGVERLPFLCGGSTALHIAAAQGDVRTCLTLLEGQVRHPGLDLRRIRNMLGLTPLNCALLGGHHEIVRVLVDAGRRGGSSTLDPDSVTRRAVIQATSLGLHSTFPEALREHMLSVLRRAALLVQLKQIADGWSAKGQPADAAAISIPGLDALSLAKITRLQRMLQRQEASLRDVLFGLESALRGPVAGPSTDSDEDGEDPAEHRNNGVAPATAGGASAQAMTFEMGSDGQQGRRRNRRQQQAAEGLGRGGRNSRRQRRLQHSLAEVATLAGAAAELRAEAGGDRETAAEQNESVPAAPSGGLTGGGEKVAPLKADVGGSNCPMGPSTQEDCHICMDAPAEVEFRPCSHSICFHCACRLCMRTSEVAQCPFCRGEVEGVKALPGARGAMSAPNFRLGIAV